MSTPPKSPDGDLPPTGGQKLLGRPGEFLESATLQRMIDVAFSGLQAITPPPAARRRKKLWELHQRCHCPIVGTCLTVAEIRKLAARVGIDEREMSDYAVHVAAVGHCESRTELAERLQRYLERHYRAIIARFVRVRGNDAVLALWKEAVTTGNDIAGALWAAWTHPDLDDDGAREIYGDIHMLSHQIGASVRANLRRLEQLKHDNARLRDEAAALRLGLAAMQRDRDRELAELRRRLAEAEQRAALLARRDLELAEARQRASDYATLHERAQAMIQRIEALEERNAANARRANALELALGEARASLAATEAALESALGVCDGVAGAAGCGRACPAEAALAGRCVLCVGGRTRLVAGYRQLVEIQGGRFLHHDGGQEESAHRIDGLVSGADAVICQSGCVSHAAYQRIKEACKKLGKPCVFVQSPGVGSFARSLAALTGEGTAQTSCGRLAS